MAYQSLYRRYRPRRFSDVRGQEQVVRALRNAVRDEKVGHAYLFSGPRGTGKTSTARILAKALNCENLDAGEPCGTCESCTAIDSGTSYDVQELDAASNRGVDDIKDLIGRVALGSPGRHKVYILDEVHMLTPAASAALLKTLEEPPEHVVFVLATTDPHKVLATIRSRTQHYEFRLLGADELVEHVQWVIHDAGLEIAPEVVEQVVRQGGGSARDTLSALERAAAADGDIGGDDVVIPLVNAVAASDSAAAFIAVAEALNSGREPRLIGEGLLERLRDVFLLRMGAPVDHLTPGELDRVKAWADQLGDRATTRALEAVGDALIEIRQAPDPRIPLELALIKITKADKDDSLDGLVARIAKLEASLASGTVPAPVAAPAPASPSSPFDRGASTPAASSSTPTPTPSQTPSSQSGSAEQTGAAESSSGSSAQGPAAAARAQLAATRAAAQGAQGGMRGSASGSAGGPSPSTPQGTGSSAGAESAPTTSSAASRPQTPPTPMAQPSSAGSSAGGADKIWTESVLPLLSGLTKAMYQGAELVSLNDGIAVVRVANEPTRQNCERRRSDVEAALLAAHGSPVKVVLETGEMTGDQASSGGSVGSAPRSVSAAPISDDPEEHLAGVDVHDLEDAPEGPAGGAQAILDAFPGTEEIE